ncbi:LisH domain-containing protein armc9 [Podochytrium sp. JEL0797]|nr:LisH domain-containing protein armc9 [Podochytrium sp. JEL0797]
MLLDPKREIDINTLILEYLRYADYRSTSHAFDHECGVRGRVPEGESVSLSEDDPDAATRLEEVKNRFLIAFRDGDSKEFFTLWDAHFPPKVVKTDALYQKMGFQVSIYFAVFPIHPFVNPTAQKNYSTQTTMETFKHFLETRGSELCKTTQFLSFYALPYVPDARLHPSFHELFTERHVQELETRLDSFLGTALRGASVPRIVRILGGVDMRPMEDVEATNSELKSLRHALRDSEDASREFEQKHRGLQRDYHNLLTIASELVQTLAACINGEKITAQYLTSICQRVGEFRKGSSSSVSGGRVRREEEYEVHQNPVVKANSKPNTHQRTTPSHPATSHSRIQTSHIPPTPHTRDPSNKLTDSNVLENLDAYMDYEKLQSDLRIVGDDDMFRKQAFVMQALRMRITRAESVGDKRRVLKTYFDNDVLGVLSGQVINTPYFSWNSNNFSPQDVILPLLQTGPHLVCEQVARFLNTITSECMGRDYVLAGGEDSGIVAALVEAMCRETRDSLYQQNLLGALQKLSLRRSAQSILNKMHVLDFLHELLEKSDTLSDYTCEYGTALFMNLCLRTDGRKQCLQNPVRTLETLLGLLEIDSMQIQTYVNGALYSLLSEPDFRQVAKSLRLNESLLFLQKSANDQVKGQINFVLEQMDSSEEHDDAVSEDGADEDEEEDEEDQDPEEDFDQLIPSFPHDKAGPDALLPYCNDTPQRANTHHSRIRTGGLAGAIEPHAVRKSMTGSVRNGALAVQEMKRPKTPVSRSNTPGLGKGKGNVVETSWPEQTDVSRSVDKLPVVVGGKGGTKKQANVPVTENEYVFCEVVAILSTDAFF